jgi:preprotein translocase subunit SecE|tara:strand:+ start:146 stop:514 length:369 start_codon:yes stop_codon:yes gene_type:complete
MNAKTETTAHKLDPLLWVVIAAIVLGGVYANTIYASVTLIIRALAGVGIFAVAIAIAMQTASGKSAWNLLKEGRVEIRKVVWPTQQETTQTTLIVVVAVFLVGLLLWGLDSLLSFGVQAVIG